MPGKRNKSAGLGFERWLAQIFRWLGFANVVTTRFASRLRDSQKVDLMNQDEDVCGRLPYNVQAKNSVRLLKYDNLLSELPNNVGIMNILIHNRTKKNGERFVTTGQYVIMHLDDMLTLIQQRDDKRSFKKLVSFSKKRDGKAVLRSIRAKSTSRVQK